MFVWLCIVFLYSIEVDFWKVFYIYWWKEGKEGGREEDIKVRFWCSFREF